MQEVLVADVMQRTLFSIRNEFYRRTVALDLSSFGEQGSAELVSRFTSDMDSVGQGLNTLFSKVTREPMRIASCLSMALCSTGGSPRSALILVPVSALTAKRAGQIMKRGRPAVARKHVEYLQDLAGERCRESSRRQGLHNASVTSAGGSSSKPRACTRRPSSVAMIDAMSDPILEMLDDDDRLDRPAGSGSYLVLNNTIGDLNFGFIQLCSLADETAGRLKTSLTLYAMLADDPPTRSVSSRTSPL